MTKDNIYPAQPYRGLRYYDVNDSIFFAGRDKSVQRCTRLLHGTKVLVLHGRSGCGKSSFLRAGVKPLIEASNPTAAFANNPSGFEVIRSTDRPIEVFANELLRQVKTLNLRNKNGIWALKNAVQAADLNEFRDSIIADADIIRSNSAKLYESFRELNNFLKFSPIFVVDQAEEIFTLFEKEERAISRLSDSDETRTRQKKLSRTKRLRSEFFDFLGKIAGLGAGGARIVVSLRTEYKGQLDDGIAKYNSAGEGLRGYYLPDLDSKGLLEAIKRPTLSGSDWEDVCNKLSLDVPRSPFDEYQFTFEDRVPEGLVKELTNPEQVPEGGILPTMQVACLRLWRMADENKARKKFVIVEEQRRRLGTVELQMQEYIGHTLENACEEAGSWNCGQTKAVEKWQSILFDCFVDVQSDGRAVSRTSTIEAVSERARSDFLDEDTVKPAEIAKLNKLILKVIKYLSDKQRAALLTDTDNGEAFMLGHDSVALSLNKWRVRYRRDDIMSRRMMMSEIRPPSEYSEALLFPKDRLPHTTEILIHRDFHWDRQFPHFAADKKFAERLGINFITDTKGFDATSNTNRPIDWAEMAEKLRQAEIRSQTARRRSEDPVNRRVMVAADWHSFPRNRPTKGKKYEAFERADWKNWEIAQAQRWTDVAITDLFVGNGLVGRDGAPKNQDELRDIRKLPIAQRGKALRAVVAESLMKVMEEDAEIKCHDGLAKKFIQSAAELACEKDSGVREYLDKPGRLTHMEERKYDSLDPLVEWLMEGDSEAGHKKRYIVGSASSRSFALQAGYQLYFGTGEVTLLVRSMIQEITETGKTKEMEAEKDLGKIVQQVIKHSSWQLGLSPSQWNRGRNRALVLRLASIAYYTAEYVRTNADEFVMFVRDHMNVYMSEAKKSKGVRGVRINREEVRAAVQDCYTLLKFDDYGSEFYDFDSTTAYYTDHADYQSKSAAGEIYHELSSLRQRTVTHYETISHMIGWLRSRKRYNLNDEKIKEAVALKEYAWRHFRIYNFYDSARFMAEAALILQSKMESTSLE